MPDPTTTPIPTLAPSISPETEHEASPDVLCEPQKERLTRELAPLLP